MRTFGLLLLFSLICPFHSPAARAEFDDDEHPLTFSGNSEAEVKIEIQRVADWSKKRGWSDGKLPAIKFNTDRKLYEVNLSPLLPHGAQGMCIGPNCHGSSLFSAGILPGYRSVGESELPFWLESPLCKPIGPRDAPEPGDIVRIRGVEPTSQLHTFIYFSDKLVYEKYGTEYGIYVKSKAKAMEPYKVSPACDRVLGVPADCKVAANYFRCRSLGGYLDEQGDKVSEQARAAHAKLEEIEKSLTGAHSFRKTFPDEFHDALTALAVLAEEKLAALTKAGRLTKTDPERFLWEGIRLRARESGDFASAYHKKKEKSH